MFNADGVCCYGTNTYVEQMDPELLSGDAEVSFEVDALDLVEEHIRSMSLFTSATAFRATITAFFTRSGSSRARKTLGFIGHITGGCSHLGCGSRPTAESSRL